MIYQTLFYFPPKKNTLLFYFIMGKIFLKHFIIKRFNAFSERTRGIVSCRVGLLANDSSIANRHFGFPLPTKGNVSITQFSHCHQSSEVYELWIVTKISWIIKLIDKNNLCHGHIMSLLILTLQKFMSH